MSTPLVVQPLTFSLFSCFSTYNLEDDTITSLYNRIVIGPQVIRKKLCSGGFKNSIHSQQWVNESIRTLDNTLRFQNSTPSFVEFKTGIQNTVIGIYSNGKIRMAGKMQEDTNFEDLSKQCIHGVLGLSGTYEPFVVNNITATFRLYKSVPHERLQEIFGHRVKDIVYPCGEIPPYTVIRLHWYMGDNVVLNYTPDTGAFQVLGCKSAVEARKVFDEVTCLISENKTLPCIEKTFSKSGTKFEDVGMSKKGRGRPSKEFMNEYARRRGLIESGKAMIIDGTFTET